MDHPRRSRRCIRRVGDRDREPRRDPLSFRPLGSAGRTRPRRRTTHWIRIGDGKGVRQSRLDLLRPFGFSEDLECFVVSESTEGEDAVSEFVTVSAREELAQILLVRPGIDVADESPGNALEPHIDRLAHRPHHKVPRNEAEHRDRRA